jgi:riboflavin biosynthesis pyrimidine reductase
MRDFQLLFDDDLQGSGEGSAPPDPAMARYGKLVFPPAPPTRPWIYANFVQTLDGIVSLLGDEASGSDIGGLPEDRWLMDLLRAHADAVILGMGTLRTEQRLQRPRPRGPVFRIVHPELEQLRARLGRGRQRNVLVTARAAFQFSDFAVFDGELVDATVVTTHEGARRLDSQRERHPAVDIIAVDPAGDSLNLAQAIAALQQRYGIRYLLCEGGPSLYSGMLTAGLIDEKFLTVSPIEVGALSAHGPRPTVLPGISLSRQDAVRWRWLSCRKVAGYQFHRFRREASS